MQKINFQNLPNTTTPVNASNLNTLQTNVENAINGVVESGSNANGNYIKFDDGTLMCWKDYSVNTTIENTWGALYESSTFYVGDLAIPFVGHWDFMVSQQSGPGSLVEVGWSSNSISINIASAAKRTTATTYHFTIMGLGKWK